MNEDEVMKIAIESIPSVDSSCIEILSALLTPIIALLALYIAYQQFRINQQRLRHETYDRRLAVYKSVQKHLSIVLREGKLTIQECIEFYSEASEAAFLFDSTVQDKIEEIYKKSIDLVSKQEKLYPPDGSQGLPVGEQREKVSAEKSELLGWHTEQLKESKEFFRKKLGLKVT